jgi:inner membrane protein involved in colicin E2 resistance
MSQENIKQFIHEHRINIIDTNKRAHRHTRMNTKFFQFPEDFNITATQAIQFETEQLYTVEIAESELERIADFEQQVFNNAKNTGHYNLFQSIIQQKQEEKYLRERYPAVKKAYEHYSLILKLAESGEM